MTVKSDNATYFITLLCSKETVNCSNDSSFYELRVNFLKL